MAELNYFIKVNKTKDKNLYDIMKKLEFDGECLIDDVRTPEMRGTMRKFGIRAKPLIEKGILEPIWTPYKADRTLRKERLIRTTKSVNVTEKNRGNISRFYCELPEITIPRKRRKLI